MLTIWQEEFFMAEPQNPKFRRFTNAFPRLPKFSKTSNDFWRLPKVAKDFPTTSSCKEKHLLHFGFKLKIKIEFFGSQLFSWLSIFSAKRFKLPFLGVKLPEMTLVIFWEILPSLFSFMSQLKSNCLHLPWHEINEFGEMCPTKVKLCKIFLV